MSKEEAEQILNNQLQLWTKRISYLKNTNLDKFNHFSVNIFGLALKFWYIF